MVGEPQRKEGIALKLPMNPRQEHPPGLFECQRGAVEFPAADDEDPAHLWDIITATAATAAAAAAAAAADLLRLLLLLLLVGLLEG
jgi:hypothetical protein